jgi:hypothetical protein
MMLKPITGSSQVYSVINGALGGFAGLVDVSKDQGMAESQILT